MSPMQNHRDGQSLPADSGGAVSLLPLQAAKPERIFFIDNLRWLMIVLVISMHSADTYSPLGSWYFTDRAPLTHAELLAFAAWQMYLQSFFMGLLFFIAGTFVPGSLTRKGPAGFIRGRAFRLGLPVLFYMFVLGPVTEYFVAHSWNSTEPTSFAHEWIKHIKNGQFLQENGPLWFCLALLIFSVVYVGWTMFRRRDRASSKLPSPTTRDLVAFALAMTAGRFFIHALIPPGTSILNMHVGDFAQYILLFSAGVMAARGGWLQTLSHKLGVRWLVIVLPVGFCAWLALLQSVISTRTWSAMDGGWHWQSLAFSAWESFSSVAICVGLLVIFRQRWNTQGRLQKFLSDNAFAVYVFHPPIIILIARAMQGLHWEPLLKTAALTCLAGLATFVLSAAVFRRIPLLREIL